MKKHCFLLLLFASSAFAQPKKYQSLLWEISGNGLAKKSYLYGSMHVSEKVSYHLSDAFFKHLLAADYVANESDPSTWIALYDVFGGNAHASYLYDNKAFYAQFYQQPIKREDLFPLFVSNNNIMNNLLFRTNENQKDYQEDTYLDMFIYQTGKKYKKQVVGLEDAKASMISIMNAEMNDLTPREENMQAIVKLLRERSFNQALLDYYRDKNLDMLDSLYTLATPGNYLKALILDRNLVMAKSIDSIARKGSLFAAIGAAHLPGRDGVIELLRKKGYVLTPVVDSYTEKGRSIKKQIDEYFIKPQFEQRTTADGMIRLPMHAQPIFSEDNIGTPDLANGGIVNLKRIPLRNYLRKDGGLFSAQTLDSLFYENIPGDILDKKYVAEDNHSTFDIRSRTKTGNAQHYKYFITPLEVICVSMSGNGSYVRQYESEIFGNIKLKKYASGWETVTPAKGGFSVQAPAYYTLYGNRESNNPANVELNAWDESEKAWYFLTERTANDNRLLEDTAFELKRIHDEFYTQFDIQASAKELARLDDSYESQAVLGDNAIRLKTVVRGQKYYLLGTVRASAENTARFFKSFSPQPFRYDTQTRKFTDSTAHFSIDLPEKENEKLFWKIKAPDFLGGNSGTQKKNLFETQERLFTFHSASGKTVSLSAWTCHRYDYARNRDSLLVNLRKNIIEDFEQYAPETDYEAFSEELLETSFTYAADDADASDRPYSSWDKTFSGTTETGKKQRRLQLTGEKESYDPARGLYRLDVTAERPASQQAIKYNVFMQDGYIWWLRTLVEKGYKNDDAFIETVANSFTPETPKPEHSVFEKKTGLFFEDARSENDSIRYSALQSVGIVEFAKEDLPQLKAFLNTFDFRPDETQALSTLLEKVGRIDDPGVIPFLESCYRKEGAGTMLQLSVIRALTRQKSKSAYKKIMELLEYDLPLSNGYEISGLFVQFCADLENSKTLFPGIFQFYGVKEYHEPIVRLATQLFRHKYVNPKKGNSYRKLLLTDARLEYKRASGWKAKMEGKDPGEADYYGNSPVDALEYYCNLLFPYRKDKAVAQWLQKTANLGIAEVNLEIARLEIENGNMPNASMFQELLRQPETRFSAYRMLLDNKKPVPQWTDEDIAMAAVTEFGNMDAAPSEIALANKRTVSMGEESFIIFFFKSSSKENDGAPVAGSENKLAAVAFANNKGRIDAQSWKVINAMPVMGDAALEPDCNTIIDRLLNGSHARASFGKQKYNAFPAYLEEEF